MINDTLERLHIPNKYQSLHNRIKRNILIWILVSVSINITELSWYKDSLKEMKPYLFLFIINHCSVANNLMDLKYESFIWYALTNNFVKKSSILEKLFPFFNESQPIFCRK